MGGWVASQNWPELPRQFQRDLWQTEQNRVGSPDRSDLVSECAEEEKEQGRKDNGMSLLPSLLRRRTEDDGLIATRVLARGTTKPDVSRRQCSATTPSSVAVAVVVGVLLQFR